MSELKLVPVETIMRAIDALELYASNTLAGTHSANELRKVLLAAPDVQQPELAKYQPCGCVICTCEHETQCQGCGSRHCGVHPVGQFLGPVYQQPSPDLPHGFNHCAYNRQTGEWLYINHANTWQLFQGPSHDVELDVSAPVEALEWLRGAINATPENDKVQAGTWISTKHPRIKQIDTILAAHRCQGGE